MRPLISNYDAALFDLDGVVYLGPEMVPGAAESISQLRAEGVRVGFVTNNAARSPQAVADHLTELGVEAGAGDVVSSAQAVARLMADQLPAGSPVLVCGSKALAAEVTAVGLAVVNSSADAPVAVVQGYDPTLAWADLDDACYALHNGAQWFVSNTDSNRPTNRGLVPGAGAMMNVVASAVTAQPQIAGKPYAPLMEETIRRLGSERPLFVGDRLDTDIMGAVGVGMDSLFVFTGAHGASDLLDASPNARPTHIGHDLAALHAPARVVSLERGRAQCGTQVANVVEGTVHLDQVPDQREAQLDALWAILHLVWHQNAAGGAAAAELDQLS